MKLCIYLIIVFFVCSANAAWSKFARITPENMKVHGLDISSSKIENTNKYRIRFNDDRISVSKLLVAKSAWIVFTNSGLTLNGQSNLRRHFDSKQMEVDSNILLTSMISETYDKDGNRYFEVVLDSEIMDKTYIYVGPELPMTDGSLYYSIDLIKFK